MTLSVPIAILNPRFNISLSGIHLLQTAIKGVPIKSLILGRIDFSGLYKNILNKNNVPINNIIHLNTTVKKNSPLKKNELNENEVSKRGKEILNLCDGFGISGANENDDKVLTIYKNIIKKTNNLNMHNKKEKSIVVIHAAESDQTVKESLKKTGKTEIERTIFTLEPDLYVHVTNPTKQDLDLLHSTNKGVIICPRANGILGAGFTPVREMLKRGLKKLLKIAKLNKNQHISMMSQQKLK